MYVEGRAARYSRSASWLAFHDDEKGDIIHTSSISGVIVRGCPCGTTLGGVVEP